MSAPRRGRSGPPLSPCFFHKDWPDGPWGVNSIGRSWYVCRNGTQQSRRIGAVGAPRTNYFDEAIREADRRNRKEKSK